MMAGQVLFERVSLRNFRNLSEVEFEPAPRVNVITGDNGQGKTSLLEALYFVATTRSFRTENLRELVQQGQEQSVVRARIAEAPLAREQRVVLTGGRRTALVDGKAPPSLSSYATRTPVVAFHPGHLQLVSGPSALRRTLLDRLALFIDPPSAEARARYTRALKERQRVLEERGTTAVELEAYETIAADQGARLSVARERAAGRLGAALLQIFEQMASPELELGVRYVPGGATEPERFREELLRRRPTDQRRKRATFGPQRDELELSLEGRLARQHASQGQQRILTLALKAAELSCIEQARDAHPVLLLDDVSSELDPGRTGAVYEFLRRSKSQVFVTTTRPELFVTPLADAADRADFSVARGVLARQ